MVLVKNYFRFSPDNESGAGGAATTNNISEVKPAAQNQGNITEKKKNKSFFGRIKEALQDWSNKDQKDQDFDDTQV